MATPLSQSLFSQSPLTPLVETVRSEMRNRALDVGCRCLVEIPLITQRLLAQPQVQELGSKITQLTQRIPYLEPFTQHFVGCVASIAPEGARSCAVILSSMSGASAATAKIVKAGHHAMMGAADTEMLTQRGNFFGQMGEAAHTSSSSQNSLLTLQSGEFRTTPSSSSQLPVSNPTRDILLSDRLAIVRAQGATAATISHALKMIEPAINNLVQSTAQTTGAWHLCTGLLHKLGSYGSNKDQKIQKAASLVFQFALNVQIARRLYQNVRNASGKWNQVKQLAALGLLGVGVEAIHHVFKTDSLKTAQTLALLTMFPRTTQAWMFTQAAICAGTVGGTLGTLQAYRRKNGSYPVGIEEFHTWALHNPPPNSD